MSDLNELVSHNYVTTFIKKSLLVSRCESVYGESCFLEFTLNILQLYQFVDNGVDGEAGRRMNLQFAGNVASVCDNRMYREA